MPAAAARSLSVIGPEPAIDTRIGLKPITTDWIERRSAASAEGAPEERAAIIPIASGKPVSSMSGFRIDELGPLILSCGFRWKVVGRRHRSVRLQRVRQARPV